MEMKPPCHNRLRDYNPLHAQKTWEDSIELDVDLKGSEPFSAQSNAGYTNAIDRQSNQSNIGSKKKTKFGISTRTTDTPSIVNHSELLPTPSRR